MASAAVERTKRKLAERIAQVRGDRSQRQFARDLGVFQQNVNRYESGTTPHTDFLLTLAIKENVSVDWLLPGQGKIRRGRIGNSRFLLVTAEDVVACFTAMVETGNLPYEVVTGETHGRSHDDE